MAVKVMLDAGHGGFDKGATYGERKEKDEVLALALAVGEILSENGVQVEYTRVSDVYETPFEKAQEANRSGADYFVSIHRNSGLNANEYNGVQTLVYEDTGVRHRLAENINNELESIGFKNIGIEVRKNLVVLKRTTMPAVLVEVGFINSDIDNKIYDEKFYEIATAIADGILQTIY